MRGTGLWPCKTGVRGSPQDRSGQEGWFIVGRLKRGDKGRIRRYIIREKTWKGKSPGNPDTSGVKRKDEGRPVGVL